MPLPPRIFPLLVTVSVRDVFQGKAPLSTVFWLYGVLGGSAFYALSKGVIYASQSSSAIVYVFVLVLGLTSGFLVSISYALSRCATNTRYPSLVPLVRLLVGLLLTYAVLIFLAFGMAFVRLLSAHL